jgi:predicted DNA-binding transcriptional regulator AlpA
MAAGDDRYITRAELRAIFPVSDMTIWRWERDPTIAFPAPVKIGRGRRGRNFWWLPAIREVQRRRSGPALAAGLQPGAGAQQAPTAE